jgi:hypothetical protein
MTRKTKTKKWQKTGLETNADILERIGGAGGAAKRYSQKKRPDIMNLRKKSKPLTTKSESAKMVRANKAEIAGKKKKTSNTKARLVKTAKVTGSLSALGTSAAVGYTASQWINQKPAKKK